jgi:hypothetical protein
MWNEQGKELCQLNQYIFILNEKMYIEIWKYFHMDICIFLFTVVKLYSRFHFLDSYTFCPFVFLFRFILSL